MRTTFLAVLLSAAVSTSVYAQGPAQGRRAPADHWMTIDSLVAAVGVTDAQKADVTKHYDELNAVMKKAAAERQKVMGGMGAGERPSQEQMQAFRTTLESLQTELDGHYKAIRGLLNADQQAKFDALPAPRVAMRRPPGGGN